MKVTWKGEDLGEFKGTPTIQEMIWIKSEAPEFKNPMRFLMAAGAIATQVPVMNPDGSAKLDEAGKPVFDVKPSEDWDPQATALFIAMLMRRQGKRVNVEDVDGQLSDLVPVYDAEERALMDAEAGKAPAAEDGEDPTLQ